MHRVVFTTTLSLVVLAAAAASAERVLKNAVLAAAVSAAGCLSRIENQGAGETYEFPADCFAVLTEQGEFSNRAAIPTRREATRNELRFTFVAEEHYDVTLEYTLQPEAHYLTRRLILSNLRRPVTLLNIDLGRTRLAAPPKEVVRYDTFWNAPTVEFLRWEKGGLFAGIENPFFTATMAGNEIAFSFAPALQLKPGERYASEPQFIGVYQRSGVMVADHYPKTKDGWRPRFRNPSGHLPLDRSEIRAMQQFAADYLSPQADRFHFILYNFFYPLPQMPRPGSPEEATHLRMIDTFHELGGDLIIFNPMFPYQKPGRGMDARWELAPPGSAARTILDHAARQGMKFGFYMGCARHGGEGNAAALPFVPEKTEWKKVDEAGNRAGENCLACDEFAAWWHAVQRNTISQYKLGLWSWDPGPGNGLFCYSDQHGHLPGQGGYKGWRNATALMRRLKEEFPGLYFQAYYGRKEYGLWGLKYVDQHESYWEQTVPFQATMHPDLHADRVNADGIRLQSWWNNSFRFLPNLINHAMVHRIQEGFWDQRLIGAWDHLGWKYSLMSGLAVGGSLTTVILPDHLDDVPGMREFYARWLGWARQNFEYARYNVAFGHQVRPGGVDGWARIKGERGFIFLCNPGPRPARTTFSLDDEIGLHAKGRCTLKELYPEEGRSLGRVFTQGDRVTAVVPAYEVMLLELAPLAPSPTRAEPPAARTLVRFLDDWRTTNGTRFSFPYHAKADRLALRTAFHADLAIRTLLEAARPRNLADFEPLLPEWRRQYPDNFAWARPDRLWLVLPFTDADRVRTIALQVNDTATPVECHAIGRKIIYYADLTDRIKWGQDNTLALDLTGLEANQFLGPYLDYPPAPAPSAVIYDRPVDADMPRRVGDPNGKAPVIVSVAMKPDYLREGAETAFTVEVDRPPEQLEAVYISAPFGDQPMHYDVASGRWIFPLKPPGRQGLIMDVPSYHVWAAAKNGLVSEPRAIPLKWRFR